MTYKEFQAPFWRTYEAGRQDVLGLAHTIVNLCPDITGEQLTIELDKAVKATSRITDEDNRGRR